MSGIILLNSSNYPKAFENIKIKNLKNQTICQHVENRLVDAVNNYNHKLNVSRVEYADISAQFLSYKFANSNGVIVDEFEVNEANIETYKKNGCYIYKKYNKFICRKILMYIFVSNNSENSRTSFVSQTIFPTLIDYTNDYLESPSYDFANHKFCYINILNNKMTAKMILRHMASLYLVGFDYIEIFDNDILNIEDIPKDIKNFLKEYSTDFYFYYDIDACIYEDEYYKVDFVNMELVLKVEDMIASLKSIGNNRVDFHGSKEKFYWMEIIPISLIAYRQGYKIDYTDYEKFILNYENKFSPKSKKFERCKTLMKYFKKIFI